jgi:hypothetical protein
MSLWKKTIQHDLKKATTIALVVALVSWSLGSHYFNIAHASNLTTVSVTLSDSRPGIAENQVITYVNPSSTTAGQTISYTYDPTSSLFGGIVNVSLADVTSTGVTIVASCSAGANRATLSTSTTALTLTVCASNTVNSGTISLTTLNSKITNPTSTGSYIVRIAAGSNSADTRVAIVNGVNVTASVATTFSFTVAGLATSTTLGNNATTTNAATSSSLPFGALSPGAHAELGQQLTITTNASNGFIVTVHDDQDLLSNTGNRIWLFANGAPTSTPNLWRSPSSTIGSANTYGHIGVTSDDADYSNGLFGTSTPKYAGAFQSTTTLTLFSATGTADGVTQNIGAAKVAYRIEIGSLQAAANDYTNNLIYIATPTF